MSLTAVHNISPQPSDVCEEISLGGSESQSLSTAVSPRGPFHRKADSDTVKDGIIGSHFNPRKVFRAVRHVHQTPDKYRFEIVVEDLCLRLPHTNAICNIEWIRGMRRCRFRQKKELSTKTDSCSWVNDEPLALVITLFRAPGSVPYVPANADSHPTQPTIKPTLFSRIRKRAQTECNLTTTAAAVGTVGMAVGTIRPTFGTSLKIDNAELSPISSSYSPKYENVYHPKETKLHVLEYKDKSLNPTVIAECKFSLADYAVCISPNYQRVTLPLTKCLDHQATLTFLISCTSLMSDNCASPMTHPLKTLHSFDLAHQRNRTYSSYSNASSQSGHTTSRDVSSRDVTGGDGSMVEFDTASFGNIPSSKTNTKDSITSPFINRRGRFKTLPMNVQLPSADDSSVKSMSSTDTVKDKGKETTEVLLDRINELESRLIQTQKQLTNVNEDAIREKRQLEASHSSEMSVLEAKEKEVRQNLSERDEQVSRLIKQLEGLHEALKRSQRQSELTTEQMESNKKCSLAQSTAVESILSEENTILKKRLAEGNEELNAYHRNLDIETQKRSKQFADAERRYIEAFKSWNLERSCIDSKLTAAGEIIQKLEKDKFQLSANNIALDSRIQSLQQQWTRFIKDPDGHAALTSAHKELKDALASKNAMETAYRKKETQHRREVAYWTSAHQQRKYETENELRQFETQRCALRERIVELEREMSYLPRASMVQKLNAKLNAATLKLQLSSNQQDVNASDGNGTASSFRSTGKHKTVCDNVERGIHDPQTAIRLYERVTHLEEELVKTKVAVAETETQKELEINKMRKKNLVLAEQNNEYALLVSDLEVQITDQKMKARTIKTSIMPFKPFTRRNNVAEENRFSAAEGAENISENTKKSRMAKANT